MPIGEMKRGQPSRETRCDPAGPGWLRNPTGPPQGYPRRLMDSITEITLLGGERHRVDGDAKQIEQLILDAARGSILQFAWMTDAESAERLGINPEHVMTLREISSTDQAAASTETALLTDPLDLAAADAADSYPSSDVGSSSASSADA